MDKKRCQFDKLRNRKTGYSIATVAYYGPDDRFATKVVVGIQLSEKDEEPHLKKWFAKDQDVCQDKSIVSEIFEFIEVDHIRQVSMLDRIIGCPHEEGIDYPEGKVCPQCPFWKNRDRWTGEIIS
jgi:hypothetical protein